MSHVDYRALRYLMGRSNGTERQKRKQIEKFDRAYRKGQCSIPDVETQQQKWWRCEARFLLGDYSSWAGWQYRSDHATSIWFRNPFQCPVWTGERVGRLAVIGEQGLGDEILFGSLLPELKEKVGQVVLETDERLRGVFERSMKIATCATLMKPYEDPDMGWKRTLQEPEADAWVSLADLPRVYRHTDSDFPRKAYITPDPERVAQFAHLRGRIGISWRGRQGERKELIREFPNAISLQYDQGWDEDVERPDVDLKEDIEGVMGVLANLDRVVTVSTSVAHIASAMGVATEVRLADLGTGQASQLIPWKWVNRKHPGETLWYPKTTKVIESKDMRLW